MLNVHFTGLAIIGLALLLNQLIPVSAQLTFPLFTAPSSYSLIRRFAPRLSSISINKKRRNSLVNNLLIDSEHQQQQQQQNLFNNLTKISNYHQNPYYEFYLNQLSPQQSTDQTQNEFVNNLLPVNIHNLPATIELINSHLNNQFNNHQFNNDLNQLSSDRIENRLDNQLERINQDNEFNRQLINHQFNNPHLNHQSILINHHHPIRTLYSQPTTHFYLHQPSHLINHPHLNQLSQQQKQQQQKSINHGPSTKNFKSIVNQTPSYSLLNKVQHLKQKLKQQKIKLRQTKLLDYQLKQLTKLNTFKKKINNELTTLNPLNEQLTTSNSQLARTGYLEIGSTAHLNEFGLETDESDQSQYLDNNLEDQLIENEDLNSKELNNKIINDTLLINNNKTTGNVNNNQQLQPTVTSLIREDLENLLKQFKPTNLIQFTQQNLDHQLELKSKYAYDLIGTNSTNNQQFNQNVQVDFKERTAPDISAGIFSRALGSLTNYLPNSMKITRTSGCVGGTRCQFFLSCWISSGSLGSSCGPLSTCCITPSKQDIQPLHYGPVINDPQCGRSATRISRIVGGMDASFGQFPWQAFVQVGGSRCGGALVGVKHVVTAGHCVARSQHNPSDIRVTLGDYILNSDIESLPHEVFTVAEVRLHPNFRFTPQADRYDVAVLILDRNVQYRNNIKPICLPQKDANYLGRVAFVAGWGALSAGSKLRPKVLQHVNVPVIDNNVCEIWHRKRGINIKIHDEMICAGYSAGNKDACQGDSGGPLMLNEFGVWYLIGIVSAGYSCAKSYQPGIYHRVSSSSDWVSSAIYSQSQNT